MRNLGCTTSLGTSRSRAADLLHVCARSRLSSIDDVGLIGDGRELVGQGLGVIE